MNRHAIPISAAKGALRAGVAILACLAVFEGSRARAANVASYTFTGDSLTSSDVDAQSTASDIVIGAGLAGSANFFNPSVNPPALGMGSDQTSSAEATAIVLEDFFSFTLTPGGGDSLDYGILSFNLVVNNFSNAITANISVRWSVDAFATPLTTETGTAGPGQNLFSGGGVDLSSFPAQSSPVIFRFYFFDDQDTSNSTVGIDSITLAATVVPEPSVLTLCLAGGVLIARRRRT